MKLIIPKLAKVTITPEIIIPLTIIGKAYQNLIPKTNAAIEPVQAPVIGSGIATKNNKNNAPYFSNFSLFFRRVLLKSHSKNTLNNRHRHKKSEKGFK